MADTELESSTRADGSLLPQEQIYNLAESIARALKYEVGEDIDDIVHKLGGRINVVDFWEQGDDNSGSLIVRNEGDFEINIPSHTSPARDRFTIAHELGHYILHYLYPKITTGEELVDFCANRYGSGRAEWESNWFAAAFLMPEKEFRKHFNKENGNLNTISDHFNVSFPAVTIRAKALKLIE